MLYFPFSYSPLVYNCFISSTSAVPKKSGFLVFWVQLYYRPWPQGQSGPILGHKTADSGSPTQGGFHTEGSWVGEVPCQHKSQAKINTAGQLYSVLHWSQHITPNLYPVILMVLARVLCQACGFSPMGWGKRLWTFLMQTVTRIRTQIITEKFYHCVCIKPFKYY